MNNLPDTHSYTVGYVEYEMAVAYEKGHVTRDELFEEADRNLELIQAGVTVGSLRETK